MHGMQNVGQRRGGGLDVRGFSAGESVVFGHGRPGAFRVDLAAWDQQLGTLTWCLNSALRAVGGS